MRGVNCPFEHSDDVIIPTSDMMFPQFPFVPPHTGRGGGRGGVRGHGRGQPMHNGHGNGFPHPMSQPPPFSGMSPTGFPSGVPSGFPMMGMPFMPFQSAPSGDAPVSYWGSSKPPQDRTSTTLIVTDIPTPSLSIQTIRNHFAQFGEITNVALEGKSNRALVSFGNNAEAYQAWKSDEAVFGSRHVKVLWHRPRPGQGSVGQKALEASAGLMANMKAMEDGSAQPQGSVKASLRGPESRLAATLTELEQKEKRTRTETLMAEQKVLLKRAKDGSKEEKVAILTRLKELSKEMDGLDKSKTKPENVAMSDKERLDKELEKHGMETNDQDELMRLSAQLSALRDKVGLPLDP